jgi:hypothetical protein
MITIPEQIRWIYQTTPSWGALGLLRLDDILLLGLLGLDDILLLGLLGLDDILLLGLLGLDDILLLGLLGLDDILQGLLGGLLLLLQSTIHISSRNLKEICPRGNNNIVIIIFLVHDNVYIPS